MKFRNRVNLINLTVRADEEDLKEATIKALKYAIYNIETGQNNVERDFTTYGYKFEKRSI